MYVTRAGLVCVPSVTCAVSDKILFDQQFPLPGPSIAVRTEAQLRYGGYLRRSFDQPYLDKGIANALRQNYTGDRVWAPRPRAPLGAAHRGIRRRGTGVTDVRQVRGACRPVLSEPPTYLANAGDCRPRGAEEVGVGVEEAREPRRKRESGEGGARGAENRELPTIGGD